MLPPHLAHKQKPLVRTSRTIGRTRDQSPRLLILTREEAVEEAAASRIRPDVPALRGTLRVLTAR